MLGLFFGIVTLVIPIGILWLLSWGIKHWLKISIGKAILLSIVLFVVGGIIVSIVQWQYWFNKHGP